MAGRKRAIGVTCRTDNERDENISFMCICGPENKFILIDLKFVLADLEVFCSVKLNSESVKWTKLNWLLHNHELISDRITGGIYDQKAGPWTEPNLVLSQQESS